MTTDAREHDGPTSRAPTGFLGALAGVTPVVMVVSLAVITDWGWEPVAFIVTMLAVSALSVVGGWFVGTRIGPSLWSSVCGAVAYLARGYLILVTIGLISAIAATLGWLGDGAMVEPATVVGSIVFISFYGLVTSLFVFPFLIPFGVGWALTYHLLRRGMDV